MKCLRSGSMNNKEKKENLADAFKRGMDYSKKFRAFKEDVQGEKNWSLRVRLSAILASLFVGAIVGLVALTLLAAVEFFNSFWKPKIVTNFNTLKGVKFSSPFLLIVPLIPETDLINTIVEF